MLTTAGIDPRRDIGEIHDAGRVRPSWSAEPRHRRRTRGPAATRPGRDDAAGHGEPERNATVSRTPPTTAMADSSTDPHAPTDRQLTLS